MMQDSINAKLETETSKAGSPDRRKTRGIIYSLFKNIPDANMGSSELHL